MTHVEEISNHVDLARSGRGCSLVTSNVSLSDVLLAIACGTRVVHVASIFDPAVCLFHRPGFFHCLRCHEYMLINVDFWSFVVLSTVNEPLKDADKQPDAKGNNAVVHVAARGGQFWREEEKHGRDGNICYTQEVCEPRHRLRQDEASGRRKHAPHLEHVDGDGNSVGYAEGDDRAGMWSGEW